MSLQVLWMGPFISRLARGWSLRGRAIAAVADRVEAGGYSADRWLLIGGAQSSSHGYGGSTRPPGMVVIDHGWEDSRGPQLPSYLLPL